MKQSLKAMHTSNFQTDILAATLQDARRYKAGARTGWPGDNNSVTG